MNRDKQIKSMQEHAVASWVNWMKQQRVEKLFMEIQTLKSNGITEKNIELANLSNAIKSIGGTEKDLQALIQSNRGGNKGMHGFLAEIMEVGVGNAKALLEGKDEIYTLIDDNSKNDLVRAGINIQQKFVQSGNKLSLNHVLEHLEKYPDYIEMGGVYQIPKDHYQQLMYLRDLPEEVANKMATQQDGFSLSQWQYVQSFMKNGNVPIENLEGSEFTYQSVQRDVVFDTLDLEKTNIQLQSKQNLNKLQTEQKQKQRTIEKENGPSFEKGLNTTLFSATIEGSMSFGLCLSKKLKSGKTLSTFTEEDWKEVLVETGCGSAKGAIRGATLYSITNYAGANAAVGNGVVSAGFAIAEQVYQFRKGTLDENTLLENAQIVCADAVVASISAMIGQVVLPVPVVGAIIGNAIGMFMYEHVKDNVRDEEQYIFDCFKNQQEQRLAALGGEYREYAEQLEMQYQLFVQLLEDAFSNDLNNALNGSIALANYFKVPVSELLKTKEEIDDYFLL